MPLKDQMPSPGGQNGSFRSPALRLSEDERAAFGKACQKGEALKGCTKDSLRCNAHTVRELHALRGGKVQGVPFF